MKRDFLKNLGLADDVIESIMSENSKDIIAAQDDLENYRKQAKELQDDIKNRDKQIADLKKNNAKQIADLKKNNANNEELQEQLTQIQADNKKQKEDYEFKIKQLKIDTAVDKAITARRGKNVKAIKALLDLENVEVGEDGTINGLSEQFEQLTNAEDSAFLFDVEDNKPKPSGARISTGGPTPNEFDFNKATYTEMVEFLNANPGTKI